MAGSRLVCLSAEPHPRFEIIFGGKYEAKSPEIIVAEEFIGEKSYKARGKRLTTFEVKSIREIEPLMVDEPQENAEVELEITNPEELFTTDEQMKLEFK